MSNRNYSTIPYDKSTHRKLEVSLHHEYEVRSGSNRCEVTIRFLTFEMPTARTIDEVMFDVQVRVKEMLGLNDE